ncbi:lipopolysaccharide kinase InaA family protein [Shewanella surugensis]|uniref:Serine/threonine protein phosphatase n=1 Tax=Shewanella surugensis TaxID=212020 RepID=A0ABT0LG39_9GAMM|nr:lipopolysaccharide kinase InaA family protein [Shewanella surugensis]MCL1126450.1 serine/threonine protein phosphatase [Shewanella surugensis]
MVDNVFKSVITELLALNKGERISNFEYQGKLYWLKQAEHHTGLMRLLKPHPLEAIKTEVYILKNMAAKFAPVPKLVLAEEDFFVVEDVGSTVKQWLTEDDISSSSTQQILNDSAAALAHLHTMNLAHGRPALRDISWQDGQVTFIDFEASQYQKDIEYQQVRDILVFLHSLYRYLGPLHDLIVPVINSYRQHGGEAIWQRAALWLRKWQWLYYPVSLFKHRGGRDITPIYWVLRYFRVHEYNAMV